MRARVAASVLLAALAACALPPQPGYAPRYYEGNVLRARLLPTSGGAIGFQVSRPAHVTVFEIDPMYGVNMIYPRFHEEALTTRAGAHTVWRSWSRHANNAWYGSGFYPASFGQRSSQMMQPRIFYLIASERPLRVQPYVGSSLALRAAMGGMMYASPQSMLDGLTRLVVPHYASDDWVTDIYMEWPQPTYQTADRIPTHALRCDGRTYVVPFYVTTCPIERVAPPVRDSTVVVDDGTTPRQPERRRPERPAVGEDRGRSGAGAALPERPTQPERGARPDRTREPAAEPRGGEPTREARPPQRVEPRSEPRGEARPRPEPSRDREARPIPAERPRETDRSTEPPRSAPPPAPPQAERPMPRSEPPPRAEPRPEPRSEPPAPRQREESPPRRDG